MRLFRRNAAIVPIQAVIAALLITICLQPDVAAADQCSDDRWTKAAKRFAYPEEYTDYYVFNFDNNPDEQVMLTLTAQFPYARYIGYTLYSLDNDDTEGNPIIYNGEVQHLSDIEIKADEYSANPYLNDVPRNIENRNYSIYIVKEGSYRIPPNGEDYQNKLVIPDSVSKVSLFLRIYVPDDENDPQGGVELPIITASKELDAKRVTPIQCPAEAESALGLLDIVDGRRIDKKSILLNFPDKDKIETYRAGDYGLFPNGDCPYLTAPLVYPPGNGGKIAVLRFKAPTFPDTRAGDEFSKEDEVRYWSVCMGDWKNTTTTACIADQDAKIDENGFVNLVIGPPDKLVFDDSRWNNLLWSTNFNPILIFRQITPRTNFEGSFEAPGIAFDETTGTIYLNEIYDAAISTDPNNTSEEEDEERNKVASFVIDEYAPIGKYCMIEDFNNNNCGF